MRFVGPLDEYARFLVVMSIGTCGYRIEPVEAEVRGRGVGPVLAQRIRRSCVESAITTLC